MTQCPLLKLLVVFLVVAGSFNSQASGQQILTQGFVAVDGQQVLGGLIPSTIVGDVQLGEPSFQDFASGRLTVSDGASLRADRVGLGGDQTAGVLEARGFGTSLVISQSLDLFSGSFSVADGASANVSSLSNFTPVAPTINVSGVGAQLSLGSGFLDQGTINISDVGTFTAGTLDSGAARINLTDGGQAVINNLNFGSSAVSRNVVSIGDTSSLVAISNFTIAGDSTVTLEGGLLIGNNGININQSGDLVGYGDVLGEIQLEGFQQGDSRLTVTAGETLRTSGIRNFDGRITNLGTLDAGSTTIENGFDGRYLGENSTIRAGLLINEGTFNLTNGRNFVDANLENRGGLNISGGASVIFMGQIFNTGVIHTAAGSTSTLLAGLTGSGLFEGEGDVLILAEFFPGNSPGLVSFASDLALGTDATTRIEIGGTLRSTVTQPSSVDRYDAFDVGGTLTLGGGLQVALLDGFDIESDQEFIIADVDDSLVGQFNGLDEGALVGNFGGTELFISYVAGDGNDVSLFAAATPDFIPGDSNQDGVVDFADIPTFIAILSSGDFLEEADTNQDGVVDFADIPAFIAILTGN